MCHSCCSGKVHTPCSGIYVYYYPYPVSPQYYQPACCPGCGKPVHLCACEEECCEEECRENVLLPQELSVDNTNKVKEIFAGGLEDANLTLEYMPVTPATATVKVTITGPGGTTVWDGGGVADGYHVKDDFAPVAPGSKIKIEVNDCIARLRWCEEICC